MHHSGPNYDDKIQKKTFLKGSRIFVQIWHGISHLLILQQLLPPPLSILPGFQLGNSCDVSSLPQLVPFVFSIFLFLSFIFFQYYLKEDKSRLKRTTKPKVFGGVRAEFNTRHLHGLDACLRNNEFCTIIVNLR